MKNKDEGILIAEFMGYGHQLYLVESPETGEYLRPKFHCSWDWLVPVIKKIGEVVDTNHRWDEVGISQNLNPYTYDIDSIYKAVIEFIKSYNFHKNK